MPSPTPPPKPVPMPVSKSNAVAELLSILDLEQLETNLFRGNSPQVGWQRVFGGQVIGQALVAATRTVEGRKPHSLHAYFMLPGDPTVPIIYEVERIRDGRQLHHAQGQGHPARPGDIRAVGLLQVDEEGLEHQRAMPPVPRPDACPARPTSARG